ncbi:VWA domain-containing protein [Tropicimonas sp. IMCC34011]|uniref:VWA domain-containing protein n=1 Tax=Tropicimonas sp. IMCC34011 TaxID=2248759 RepID=UPI000E26B89D|nr:VWA domain-containing protein [Tropicimonas sp. IMCC34011]
MAKGPTKTSDESSVLRRALARFVGEQHGGLVIFSLFLLSGMLLAVSVGLDTMRFELRRTQLQNTLDNAVLAAADLDQTLEPQDVVRDYFDRAGLDNLSVDVSVEEGLNYRSVSASTSDEIRTLLMRLVGIDTLKTPAAGTANETIMKVEISLVLDNSGSMGSYGRLNLLKDAAKDFVDTVLGKATEQDRISINIVPFATQVNAGEDLLKHYNVSQEHRYSWCVDFRSEDFTTPAILPNQRLQRTGHFEISTYSKPPDPNMFVCPILESREITVMESDIQALHDRIDSFWAQGNTSIDIGAKWGAALLDPATRPIIADMIGDGAVSSQFNGRPYNYDEEDALKVLVVMSDGENTSQHYLRDEFSSGTADIYYDRTNGRESLYYRYYGNNYWYWFTDGDWHSAPYRNWDRARTMTWPELWASRSVANYAYYDRTEALGGNWRNYYDEVYSSIGTNTKNSRTSAICEAAKNAGVVVFTIGMETRGNGDDTLSDCASTTSHFFDVRAIEIAQAFSSIARQINQLRLTQ